MIKLIIIVGLLCGIFFVKGLQSRKQASPDLSSGPLPLCGAKPNCVCSLQNPDDPHCIEAIDLANHGVVDVISAIESIGGKITANDDTTIQATFTSAVFRFVDDLAAQIADGKLDIRSSSRVGYSDIGVNRRRVERLRKILS